MNVPHLSLSKRQTASLRESLGKGLLELGRKNNKIVMVNADLTNSVKSIYFSKEFPDRTIEVGIAEQNMIGVASGLAKMGYIPFCLTFARFASKRAADQISMCVDYSRNNVKIVGAYAGIFTGRQGVSQQTIEDTATMRAMPNMTVIDTADVYEVKAALAFAAQYDGPVYIRVGRDEWPVVFDETYRFNLGKGQVLREGSDIVLLNSGLLLSYVLEAAELLKSRGINAAVVNMPSVKPIDRDMIVSLAETVGAFVTVENHSILGGFGGAVSEVVCETVPVPIERIGIRDEYSESAPNEDLARKHKLTPIDIVEASVRVLRRKNDRSKT